MREFYQVVVCVLGPYSTKATSPGVHKPPLHPYSAGPNQSSPHAPRKMQPASRCSSAAPPQLRPPAPDPAPPSPSVPRLELTHRRHILCLGAGDSRGQDPGEESLAQHLPSCKRHSKGLQQQLQQGPPSPGAGRAPTRDQRLRATPCTAGDTLEMEAPGRVPRAESAHRPERGCAPSTPGSGFVQP